MCLFYFLSVPGSGGRHAVPLVSLGHPPRRGAPRLLPAAGAGMGFEKIIVKVILKETHLKTWMHHKPFHQLHFTATFQGE